MNASGYVFPLAGGVLIGLAASILWVFLGRVFGISGIVAGALMPKPRDTAWRLAICGGLFTAGLLLLAFYPAAFPEAFNGPLWRYAFAGLLVGYGTRLGGGCTSGHGVCGISRLSSRSLIATAVFIAAGMATVALLRAMGMPV